MPLETPGSAVVLGVVAFVAVALPVVVALEAVALVVGGFQVVVEHDVALPPAIMSFSEYATTPVEAFTANVTVVLAGKSTSHLYELPVALPRWYKGAFEAAPTRTPKE